MQSNKIRVGIVGVGKIARDQHLPAIESNPLFEVVAAASPNGRLEGVGNFKTVENMLESVSNIDAVALCMPAQFRYSAAKIACEYGVHVLLEKPPGGNVSEVQVLSKMFLEKGITLFASWHSRFGGAIEETRSRLTNTSIKCVQIDWKENVRKWHPGQDWIWKAGGMGVFDPGINALSIVTQIMPNPLFVTSSRLVFPENRAAPIAASVQFTDSNDTEISANLDWRVEHDEVWSIYIETESDTLILSDGGRTLSVNGDIVKSTDDVEYSGLYQRFAELIQHQQSDVDLSPLQLTADAFLQGDREITAPFVED